jgi:hypothetical protein
MTRTHLMMLLSLLLGSLMLSAHARYPYDLKPTSDYPSNRSIPWGIENQGVTHDEQFWYITQRDYMWKIPVDRPLSKAIGKDEAAIIKVGIPAHLRAMGYNHMGDIDYYQGNIYLPLEGKNPNKILVYDAKDLSLVEELDLPKSQKHASWVAVHPKTGHIYSSEFTMKKKSDGIIAYVRDNGKLVEVARYFPSNSKGNQVLIKRIQGGVFDSVTNMLILACDHKNGGLKGLDMDSYKIVMHHKVNYRPQFPYYEELEGVTVWRNPNSPKIKGDIHLMMLDNDLRDKDEIYFKHYFLF